MLALNPHARMAARDADAAMRRRMPVGPLHGMVLAIKDNIDIAGMATSSGCLALEAAMPLANATVIDRLVDGGAVIVGKTNLSEFSFEVRSRSSLGGDVLSPFAPATTAGGSSGGSAVAVARGFASAAIGTDTGGSIRIPAACNGLVGLRPAHGMLPLDGVAPLAPSTDTIGPIARTVEDARGLYLAMGGKIPAGETGAPPRIGVLRAAFGTDPRVIAACERALRNWRTAGPNSSILSRSPISRKCWPVRISSTSNSRPRSTRILPAISWPGPHRKASPPCSKAADSFRNTAR